MCKSFKFSKSLRLRTQADFNQVLEQQHNKIYSKYFIGFHLKQSLPHMRLGVIVSKRVSKHAVVRNRIRRLVKEWFRLHQQQHSFQDVVIIAKAAAANATNTELTRCLNWLSAQLTKQGAVYS